MKRLFITCLIACLAAFNFAQKANALEFHIKKMVCYETEGYVSADAIYIRYSINNGSMKRYPSSSDLSFVAGTERSNFLYLSPEWGSTIHIELWDHDTFDPDDYLGSFDVRLDRAREDYCYVRQSGGTANYLVIYAIE